MSKRSREPLPDYGYRVKINEPPFDELYQRYKKYKGIPRQIPCSDAERREFEGYVLKIRQEEEKSK